MKTGFASGNGKPLQIGWKRRRNISPISTDLKRFFNNGIEFGSHLILAFFRVVHTTHIVHLFETK